MKQQMFSQEVPAFCAVRGESMSPISVAPPVHGAARSGVLGVLIAFMLAGAMAGGGGAHAEESLACAPEARVEVCSSATIWAAFESEYRRNRVTGDPTNWIAEHLSPAQIVALHSSLESETELGGAEVGTLPKEAELARKLVMGEITPLDAASAVRRIPDDDARIALLKTLVNLARNPMLADSLAWSLDHDSTREITLPWLLMAHQPQALEWVLNQLIHCSRSQVEDCARELPNAQLFNIDQLRAAWPNLTGEYRDAVLKRVSASGVEAFLRREMLQSGDGAYLLPHPNQDIADAGVGLILARLTMERLLDPAVAQSERFQLPMSKQSGESGTYSPFESNELGAWDVLRTSPESAQMWEAMAATSNSWIAMLGVSALIADGRRIPPVIALAKLNSDHGAPPVEMLRLLKDVDTAQIDRLFQITFQARSSSIEQACVVAQSVGRRRAKLLLTDFVPWLQAALASVPNEKMPPLESLDPSMRKNASPEPVRSVICLGDVLIGAATTPSAEIRQLANWLQGEKAELYRILGAVLDARLGNLGPLERVVSALERDAAPVRQKMHKGLSRVLESAREASRMGTQAASTPRP